MNIVITGASSGIGLSLARYYLNAGEKVAAFARRSELLKTLSEEFPNHVYCYPLDVCDFVALKKAANDFMTRVGVPDIVIANAGVSRGTLTEFAEDIDAFEQVMDINVLGMVKTFHPFITAMKEAGKGKLVGIASVAGFRGLPGSGAYSASKAAAISYLESLRVELGGCGLKVITICPGYIKTPMTDVNPYPMPFILEVDDAAQRIAKIINRGCAFSVVPWQMGLVGRVMKWLPNWLYDYLLKNATYKPRHF